MYLTKSDMIQYMLPLWLLRNAVLPERIHLSKTRSTRSPHSHTETQAKIVEMKILKIQYLQ